MRCSSLIGITAETAALDFDLACSYSLMRHENRRERDRMKAYKEAVKAAIAETFGGVKPPDDDAEIDVNDDDVL